MVFLYIVIVGIYFLGESGKYKIFFLHFSYDLCFFIVCRLFSIFLMNEYIKKIMCQRKHFVNKKQYSKHVFPGRSADRVWLLLRGVCV